MVWQTAEHGRSALRLPAVREPGTDRRTGRAVEGLPGGRVQNSVWDERELVRRCKEGSEAAYAELVRQHGARLVTLAYRLTGSRETAEDVVQETFLAAFSAMERFEPRPALAPWLTTIAVRFASKMTTRQSRPTSLDALMSPDSTDVGPAFQAVSTAPDPHASAEAAELRAEVQRALDALPFKHRSAVVLRLVIGMDYAEAARAMDVPLNTYKSLLLRGTRQLRDILGPRLAGPRVEDGVPTEEAATTPSVEPATRAGRDNGTNPTLSAYQLRRVPVDRDPVEIAADLE
jgi:RNA polymerase sigma-70 factor (ECF subfamily)